MQGPEPSDYDDFDQPEVDALLRRLAGPVAQGDVPSDSEKAPMQRNIFQPPDDLTDLRRRLGEVDRRLDSGGQPRPHPAMRRLYPFLAAAAVLVLAAGLYLYVQPDQGGPSRITQIALVLVDLTRGHAADQFRVGDKVWLDLTVTKSCRAFVAILDRAGTLSPLQPDRFDSLEPGAVKRLPGGNDAFELGGTPGTESFLVLISEAPLDASEFRAIVETTARNLKPEGTSHELLLAEALATLRHDARIAVEAYTYQLRPMTP